MSKNASIVLEKESLIRKSVEESAVERKDNIRKIILDKSKDGITEPDALSYLLQTLHFSKYQ